MPLKRYLNTKIKPQYGALLKSRNGLLYNYGFTEGAGGSTKEDVDRIDSVLEGAAGWTRQGVNFPHTGSVVNRVNGQSLFVFPVSGTIELLFTPNNTFQNVGGNNDFYFFDTGERDLFSYSEGKWLFFLDLVQQESPAPTPSFVPQAGVTYHFLLTFGTSGSVLYIDGVQEATFSGTNGGSNTPTDLYIADRISFVSYSRDNDSVMSFFRVHEEEKTAAQALVMARAPWANYEYLRHASLAITPSVPDAPTNPAAVAGDEQNTITWTDAPTATSHNLYWSLSSPVTTGDNKIASVTTPYIHTGRTNGVEVFYAVAGVVVLHD